MDSSTGKLFELALVIGALAVFGVVQLRGARPGADSREDSEAD